MLRRCLARRTPKMACLVYSNKSSVLHQPCALKTSPASSSHSVRGASSSCCSCILVQRRFASSNSSHTDVFKDPAISSLMNDMMDSFAESRELIADALESAGTTYFSEDIEDATTQTADTLGKWDAVQRLLEEKGEAAALESLRRQHELKMKQLAEELETAKHAGE